MNIKVCRVCSTPLIHRRSHAVTCSSKCRNIVWRQSKVTMIPEKILFSIANHALVTKAASAAGVSVNDYVHNRAVQVMDISQ